LEPVSTEVVPYATLYGSPEYAGIPTNYPGGQFPPPPWTQPLEKVRPALVAKTEVWRAVTNYEAAQPPLYYTLAALWWRLGKVCGFHDGRLLYWLRFLNLLVVAILVWMGFAAARLVFPGRRFLRLGVPALLAFIPQSAFYSIQNDVLSPLAFGLAFICLVRLLRAEIPGVRLGILTGLALAATFLTKISNLPLLAVSGLVVLFKIGCLARSGKLRAAGPALAALVLCAGLPMIAWLAWCKHTFGDFTGTAAKIQFLNWTRMVASSDFHAAWFVDLCVGPHGNVLAGRISLASPAAGLAGRGRDLRNFIRRFRRGGRHRPAFPFLRCDRIAAAGALVRLLEFYCRGGVPGISVHPLRFPRLLLSVGRAPVFHVRPVDARRADSIFTALPLRTRLGIGPGEKQLDPPAGVGGHDLVYADFGNTH
jgi:hypothetical protein